MQKLIESRAHISRDGKFRYWLLRRWDETKPLLASIGANPSTADASVNDHTIRKDIGLASRAGYGALLKLNISAYRSTQPGQFEIGPLNRAVDLLWYAHCAKAYRIVATWGKLGAYWPEECQDIINIFPDLWCYGHNKDGSPTHTRMISYKTEMEIFK